MTALQLKNGGTVNIDFFLLISREYIHMPRWPAPLLEPQRKACGRRALPTGLQSSFMFKFTLGTQETTPGATSISTVALDGRDD